MPKLRGSDTDFGHLLKRAFGAAVFCVLEVVVRVGHCSGFFSIKVFLVSFRLLNNCSKIESSWLLCALQLKSVWDFAWANILVLHFLQKKLKFD